MPNKMSQCKVCRFNYEDFYPWGEDGKCASFEICDCCGVTFGYEDSSDESILKYRKNWLQNGAMWNNKEIEPKDWSKKLALKNIES